MTSHDVVAKVRRITGTRRVGHAGTLDPMATGVLVLGVERSTKLMNHLILTDKTYRATIRLGVATSTDDAEGTVLSTASAAGLDRPTIEAAIGTLTGRSCSGRRRCRRSRSTASGPTRSSGQARRWTWQPAR